MSEQGTPKELTLSEKLAEKIADLRSKERYFRNRGATYLAIGVFCLAGAIGTEIVANTEAVKTASRTAQGYSYDQYQNRIESILEVGGLIVSGLGALTLGGGVLSLSEARQSGNLADLLEARLILLPEQTFAPTQIEE
jgi:hypothetical protein